MRRVIFILVIVFALSFLVGCSSKEPEGEMKETGGVASTETTNIGDNVSDNTESADSQLPVFNAEGLLKYDGTNGNPAYVAYEGYVYDVSDIKAWNGGIHKGKHKAGFDYTEILNNEAPHPPTNLTDNAPIVGIYKDE